MAQLKLNHVYKRYGEFTAVQDFNLEIQDQEFLVLVGPSGCGKSTTLRMIAGLEEITEGELYIGGRLVNDVPPKDRDIAMVFQSYALYPHMNVHQNMAFSLKLHKFQRDEIDKRVRETAKSLDIEDLLNRKPKALSGGQRQRVALGRAIVREPQVFLMDEPLSNLDAKLRVQMRMEISKLHQRLKTTILYVTHDQTEAMTLGDRIVVMKEGVIQQVDSPLRIYQHPANVFVAGFIGSPSMNFIHGRLEEERGRVYFRATGLNVQLPGAKAKALREKGRMGKEVIFGIRPEDIHDEPLFLESAHHSQVTAKVEVAENMGSEMLLYLSGITDKWLTARVKARTQFAAGNEVRLALDTNKVHLFDTETEKTVL